MICVFFVLFFFCKLSSFPSLKRRYGPNRKKGIAWKLIRPRRDSNPRPLGQKSNASNHWAKESTSWRSCQRLVILKDLNFFIIYNHCSWMLCRVAAVKSLPALIYSADYIFRLVLWDHGIYSENSEMIIRLDSFSKQIWNILVFFDLYQSLRRLPCKNL